MTPEAKTLFIKLLKETVSNLKEENARLRALIETRAQVIAILLDDDDDDEEEEEEPTLTEDDYGVTFHHG